MKPRASVLQLPFEVLAAAGRVGSATAHARKRRERDAERDLDRAYVRCLTCDAVVYAAPPPRGYLDVDEQGNLTRHAHQPGAVAAEVDRMARATFDAEGR